MQRWTVRRSLVPCLVILCLPSAAVAEEVEPLPVDFLEYLASFESDGEDWTLFADEDGKDEAPKKATEARRTPPVPPKAVKEEKP